VIENALRQALAGLQSQAAVVQGIQSVTIDTAAPPRLAAGSSPAEVVGSLPGAGSWRVVVTLGLGITVGPATIGSDLTLEVDGIAASAPLDFDMTDPRRPILASAGAPQIAFAITLTSSSPVVQALTGPLTQVLGPIVRAALLAGTSVAQQQIAGAIGALPRAPWGLGGPPLAPAPQPAADLRVLALGISDEIERHHIPFATVLPAVFDQPGYGNGTPVDYVDYGDSACWNGHYLAAEALRYDLTGDPGALANAARVLDGVAALLDVASGAGDGLLSRCVAPMSSPFAAGLLAASSDSYTGTHNGVPYAGFSEISRDQYIGTMLGLTETWLRVPPLRAEAGALIGRIVHYLDGHDWIAYLHNQPIMSAPFASSPDVLWAFATIANVVDRATWGGFHDSTKDIARVLWFPVWFSSREVMDGYYKFNLGHGTMAILASAETDPALYREYIKGLEIMRDVTGHHQNAWFDAVYAAAVPTAAPQWGPIVKTELEHWAVRDRRCHGTTNSADPAVAKSLYSDAIVTTPRWVATYPLPIEKRVCGDFLGQTDPFQLDGGVTDPHLQEPGIDLVLPYWLGRSYGLFP
jgi:hypothetical protein